MADVVAEVVAGLRARAAARRASQRFPDRRRARRRPGAGYIVLIIVLAAAYFVPRGTSWNADTHLYLTASIVDRGTLNIDPFALATGDVAFAHGHYYADKAPGLSLLAVPAYALLKYTLAGGRPYTALLAAPPSSRIDFLLRYLLALLYAAVPTGILSALLYCMLGRVGVASPWRDLVALTYGLGTIARPFAGQLFSHQLAALLVFSGFVLLYRLSRGELRARWYALAGLLLGYAVITEYPTALLVAVLCLYALLTTNRRVQAAVWLAAGALPAALVGALYNTLAFGGPLSLGYAHLAGPQQFRTGQAQGLMGITYPHLDALWQTSFGGYRGLFLLSPVLLLAVPGFVTLWRRAEWRAEARLWLALVALYELFSVSYFAWDGGYSMGPRQFLPALPFLMLPIGELLRPEHRQVWRRLGLMLSAYSIVVVGLATATSPLVDPVYASPLTQWMLPRLAGMAPDAAHGLVPPGLLPALLRHAPLFLTARLDNNWGMVFGLPGLAQLLPLGLVLGLVLLLRWRAERPHATLHNVAVAVEPVA